MLVNAALLLSYSCGLAIVVQAIREGQLRRYGFFHSFFMYYLASAFVGWVFLGWIPAYYPHFFWIRFLTLLIAEFALLVQIGDHVFAVYPALQLLGRLVTLGITFVFSVFFILPPLLEVRPSEIAIYDLVKRSALTKSAIIFVLVALAGHFRVRLGRNITGMTAGLMCYLTINIANFALVEWLGWESYGKAFSTFGPLSQTLMVLIWMVGLWKYEAIPVPRSAAYEGLQERQEALPDRLGRYNTALDRLFRR